MNNLCQTTVDEKDPFGTRLETEKQKHRKVLNCPTNKQHLHTSKHIILPTVRYFSNQPISSFLSRREPYVGNGINLGPGPRSPQKNQQHNGKGIENKNKTDN